MNEPSHHFKFTIFTFILYANGGQWRPSQAKNVDAHAPRKTLLMLCFLSIVLVVLVLAEDTRIFRRYVIFFRKKRLSTSNKQIGIVLNRSH